jgi:nucleotide-binding universal stress UspA family protein
LTVLHVIDINTQSQFGPAAEFWTRLRKEASVQIGQLAGSLCGQVDAQTVLEEGLPADTIVRKSCDFDLIILGNGGHNSGWFSNHTVQRILSEAACPVMVVQSAAQLHDG